MTETKECRICLTETGQFGSVFDEIEPYNLPLSDLIMGYTFVQIEPNDDLPKTVCPDCTAVAIKMYKFKLLCEASDLTLRKRLQAAENADDEEECEIYNIIVNEDDRNPLEPAEPAPRWGCTLCDDAFSAKGDLIDHLEHHDLDATADLSCSACEATFATAEAFLEHQIVHLEAQPADSDGETELFSCKQCIYVFLKRADLDQHVLVEHQPASADKTNCLICDLTFETQAQLRRHLGEHAPVRHKCRTCAVSFRTVEMLKNHLAVHAARRPYVCEICSKTFNQISNLKDHVRTHNGEKPFLCPICGKGFNQLGNLRQHTIRHTGVKSHLCSTCGSGFSSKGELSAHLRKHTGDRPFVCPECNAGFTTSSSLTKHRRIHSGEKPYECDVCNVKFSRSGILARHKRTHTGEKPYKCSYCLKAFTQSNDLTSHQRIHTGEKPYRCEVCQQAFRQSSALKSHKRRHVGKRVGDAQLQGVLKTECVVIENEILAI